MKLPHIGECYHNRFSGKQCQAKIVYHPSKKSDDVTDAWTWCKKHLHAMEGKPPRRSG